MFFGLIETEKEKKVRIRKEKRQAFRKAESSIDDMKLKVKTLQKERDKSWQEARQYLKDGQKAAAQRCLQNVRANEVLMDRLEKKRWLSEKFITDLEAAESDTDLAKAMSAVNAVVDVDPDLTTDILDSVQEKLNDQSDIEKLWNKAHEKQMEGVENLLEDEIPSVDSMMIELSDEISGSSGAVENVKDPDAKTEQSEVVESAVDKLR